MPTGKGVDPVGDKPFGYEVLQSVTPIPGCFTGSSDGCDRVIGERLSTREGYRRLLEKI